MSFISALIITLKDYQLISMPKLTVMLSLWHSQVITFVTFSHEPLIFSFGIPVSDVITLGWQNTKAVNHFPCKVHKCDRARELIIVA